MPAQICIDLAHHLVADAGRAAARDARDSFTRLEEHGVVGPALAARLRALTGLRNRLVHLYADVDDTLVRQSLAGGLRLRRLEPHVEPMVMRGREMTGWLHVHADGVDPDDELRRWMAVSTEYVRGLPAEV